MDLFQTKIESDRLNLIPISKSHAKVIFEEFTAEITEFMYPKPAGNIEEVHDFITSSLESMKAGTNLQLVIFQKSTHEFLGCIGLHNLEQAAPELGIWLKKSVHGKGYGLEAMTALIHWAQNNIDFEFLKYPVDKRNIPSRKIPEANGGILKREFKAVNLSGNELDEVEYWIYNKNYNHEK